MKVFKKRLFQCFIFIAGVYLLLLIPDLPGNDPIIKANKKPFTWNKDHLWKQLENDFIKASLLPAGELDSSINKLKLVAEGSFSYVRFADVAATDSSLIALENNFFALAPLIAVNKGSLQWYIDHYTRLRNFIKSRSQQWDMNDEATRAGFYTLLYGMRAALEEVLLQADSMNIAPAMLVKNERSLTPVAKIFGIEVHSGDLLVSRGGAEVSALISRGNDYPGNFSHVALLYVEEKTNKAFLVEAHIEKGVAVSSVEQYENDKKLRFMVMRPRADLAVMIKDPMLPHKAAKMIYEESLKRHIPYDFKMNFHDPRSMFCSEVGSYAYRMNGLLLWQPVSTISSQGVVNWLHDFGVENFVTQMPSDLEYDPQLSVVAEWRDKETLFKDHIDNAVMDAMLEQANNGVSIHYNTWQLPVVRIIKGYCIIKNLFGKTGMIPEGMSATRALKNQSFVAMHVKIKNRTRKMAEEFIKQYHYIPPYWQLVKLAAAAGKEK